jgi:hypothetical protein
MLSNWETALPLFNLAITFNISNSEIGLFKAILS